MTMISEYFARVGADVDEASLKKVDKYLQRIEEKLKKFNPKVKIGAAVGDTPAGNKAAQKNHSLSKRHLLLGSKSNTILKEGVKLTALENKHNQGILKTVKAINVEKKRAAIREAKDIASLNKKIKTTPKKVSRVGSPVLVKQSKASRDYALANQALSLSTLPASQDSRLSLMGRHQPSKNVGEVLGYQTDQAVKAQVKRDKESAAESARDKKEALLKKKSDRARRKARVAANPRTQELLRRSKLLRGWDLQPAQGSFKTMSRAGTRMQNQALNQRVGSRFSSFASRERDVLGQQVAAAEVTRKGKLTSATTAATRAEEKLTKARTDSARRAKIDAQVTKRVREEMKSHNSELRRMQTLLTSQGKTMEQLKSRAANPRGNTSAARVQRGNYLAMGGGAGAMARYGVSSLPFIGGAMGFTGLNRSSQEHFAAPLTVQAAFEAQGHSAERGAQSWEWFRGMSKDLGVSYMDLAPDYTGFMANALGSGLGVDQSETIFKQFTEYQTAMGLNTYRRKLVTNALTQIMGKGTVSLEELRRQMAESMPGTMPAAAKAFDLLEGKDDAGIMEGVLAMGNTESRKEAADIYANLIGLSGKTDQQKMTAMMEAVAAGSVSSREFVPIMSAILSYQAQPKLSVMKKSGAAEEGRFGSAKSDLVMIANAAGLDASLAETWKTLRGVFEDLAPSIPPLVTGFGNLAGAIGRISTDAIDNIGWAFKGVANVFNVEVSSIWAFAAAGAVLATRWGRVAAAFVVIGVMFDEIKNTISGDKETVGASVAEWFGLEDGSFLARLVEFSVTLTGIVATMATLLAMSRGLRWIAGGGKGVGRGVGRGVGSSTGGVADTTKGIPRFTAKKAVGRSLTGALNHPLARVAMIAGYFSGFDEMLEDGDGNKPWESDIGEEWYDKYRHLNNPEMRHYQEQMKATGSFRVEDHAPLRGPSTVSNNITIPNIEIHIDGSNPNHTPEDLANEIRRQFGISMKDLLDSSKTDYQTP